MTDRYRWISQEINFALFVKFHSSRSSFFEFSFPLQDTRKKLRRHRYRATLPCVVKISYYENGKKKRKERNWKNYPTLTFPRTRCSIDQRSPWSFAYEPISSWISVEFMPNPRTTVQLLIRNTNYRYFSTTKPENQSVNQLVSFEHIYFNRPFDFLHKNVLSSIQLSQE